MIQQNYLAPHLLKNGRTYGGSRGAWSWANRMELALLKSLIKTITTSRFRIKHVLAAVNGDSAFKFMDA